MDSNTIQSLHCVSLVVYSVLFRLAWNEPHLSIQFLPTKTINTRPQCALLLVVFFIFFSHSIKLCMLCNRCYCSDYSSTTHRKPNAKTIKLHSVDTRPRVHTDSHFKSYMFVENMKNISNQINSCTNVLHLSTTELWRKNNERDTSRTSIHTLNVDFGNDTIEALFMSCYSKY